MMIVENNFNRTIEAVLIFKTYYKGTAFFDISK